MNNLENIPSAGQWHETSKHIGGATESQQIRTRKQQKQAQNMQHQLNDDSDPFCLQEELLAAPRPVAGRRSQIAAFYKNRSVLITGASGFIGKVLIEKLIRTCPVKRIFVLIRPKWNKSSEERLHELLAAPLFEGVRDCNLEERVSLVEGDVTHANLGLSQRNLLKIMNEVSVIFHSAATVKFDEPLKQSIAINISGTKNITELCRRMPHLAALVHVSTAYANCDRESIDEHVYPLDMDPERLIKMADWLDQDTLQELKRRLLGARPNTYTYTKALAEWLLAKSARDLPVVICRPSIVVASWREPFAGWVDNVNGPTGILLGVGKGLVRTMFADETCRADLVPVDTVINLVVALGWFAHAYKREKYLGDRLEGFSESALDQATTSGLSSLSCSPSAPSSDTNSTGGYSYGLCSRQMSPTSDCSIYETSSRSPFVVGPNTSGNDQQSDSKLATHTISTNHESNNNSNHANGYHEPLTTCHLPALKANSTVVGQTCALAGNQNLFHQDGHLMSLSDEGYVSRSPNHHFGSTASSTTSDNATIIHRRECKISSSSSLSSTCATQCADSPTSNNYNENDNNNDDNNNDDSQQKAENTDKEQRRILQQTRADFDYKLRQFRHNSRSQLLAKGLPEELADVPVFHCTSGNENPISWGRVQLIVMTVLTVYPNNSAYRYPCGSFTASTNLDNFYRITLHYIPGYLVDFTTKLFGGKPMVVKIFRKFDQAAAVLKAFTSNQWNFTNDNSLFLVNELMTDEDRRLFNCDIKSLDWLEFFCGYAIGIRKFLLKEPMRELARARANLRMVYYRNSAIQVVVLATIAYCLTTATNYFGLDTKIF